MRAARERLAAEGFSTSAREIERRLALADEMRLVLDMEHDFPGGEYPDVDYIVAKLRVEGSFLDVEEVVTLRRALAAIGGIVSFIIGREERYPALHARTRGVAAFPEIVQRIDGILDRFGNVKDDASPALQEIRRSIREREGQAAKRLQAVLSSAKGAGIVDADAQISIRDGKAVIPVRPATNANSTALSTTSRRRARLSTSSRSRWWRSTTNCASWSMPSGARSCASLRSLPKRSVPTRG